MKLVLFSVVVPVYAKASIFESTYWVTCLYQFEAPARLNKFTDEEYVFSLIFTLKRPAPELLQIASYDSEITYAELTEVLELWYGNQHLCQVYSVERQAR